MTACIVWACGRTACDESRTFCERHAPDTARIPADLEYTGEDVAYLMADGLTLAEIAALTV